MDSGPQGTTASSGQPSRPVAAVVLAGAILTPTARAVEPPAAAADADPPSDGGQRAAELTLSSEMIALRQMATERCLHLGEADYLDLALLARDCDEAARVHGTTGLAWVLDALRMVDGKVNSIFRYVRTIVWRWAARGYDGQPAKTRTQQARQRPSQAKTEPEAAAVLDDGDDAGENNDEDEIEPDDVSPEQAAAEDIWQRALAEMQLRIPRPTFEAWLKGSRAPTLEEGQCLVVAVTNVAAQAWLQERLYTRVAQIVAECAGRALALRFVVM